VPGKDYHATIQKLKTLYKEKVLGLEDKYLFHRFGFEELTDQQLEAKAQVGREGGRIGRVVTRIAGKNKKQDAHPLLPSLPPSLRFSSSVSTARARRP